MRGDFDPSAVRSEFNGVAQKVHEDLSEPGGIGPDNQAGLGDLRQHLRFLVCQRLHDAQHFAKHSLYPQALDSQLDTPGLNLGQVQNVADKAEEVLSTGVDVVDVAPLPLV